MSKDKKAEIDKNRYADLREKFAGRANAGDRAMQLLMAILHMCEERGKEIDKYWKEESPYLSWEMRHLDGYMEEREEELLHLEKKIYAIGERFLPKELRSFRVKNFSRRHRWYL